MNPRSPALLASLCLGLLVVPASFAQSPADWNFAVSGDSRNCGDIVMPAIAAGALSHQAAFYWHLGDFRAIYDFDQDYRQTHPRATIIAYLTSAWPDFIQHQLDPFGATPVYLGIGNHELIPPKTRADYVAQFADWLNAPPIRAQRLADNPQDHAVRAWYHWVVDGIDFINFDNGSPDQFDAQQLAWAEALIARDASNPSIRAVVAGMHQALPGSLATHHSMADAPAARQSGAEIYQRLLALNRQSHKPVYILASHSHFFMDGIFNTEDNQAHDAVLPGWIIGTAGAVRYALPPDASRARAAETNVYGYLLAHVSHSDPANPIEFEFHRLAESDIPAAVAGEFTPAAVHTCFADNSEASR